VTVFRSPGDGFRRGDDLKGHSDKCAPTARYLSGKSSYSSFTLTTTATETFANQRVGKGSVQICKDHKIMSFQPGHMKTGGRTKGTPNRATTLKLEEARQTFSRLSFNPIQEAIKLFRSRKSVPEHRIKLVAELMKYWAPKLSTQNVAHRIDGTLHLSEAVHQILVTADPATIRALEAVSLKLNDLEREPRAPVIDIFPALPEPSVPAPAEPEEHA
jgi:hypothetical protein